MSVMRVFLTSMRQRNSDPYMKVAMTAIEAMHKDMMDLKNANVKKLARDIIAALKKEIARMERWLKSGVGAKK